MKTPENECNEWQDVLFKSPSKDGASNPCVPKAPIESGSHNTNRPFLARNAKTIIIRGSAEKNRLKYFGKMKEGIDGLLRVVKG